MNITLNISQITELSHFFFYYKFCIVYYSRVVLEDYFIYHKIVKQKV